MLYVLGSTMPCLTKQNNYLYALELFRHYRSVVSSVIHNDLVWVQVYLFQSNWSCTWFHQFNQLIFTFSRLRCGFCFIGWLTATQSGTFQWAVMKNRLNLTLYPNVTPFIFVLRFQFSRWWKHIYWSCCKESKSDCNQWRQTAGEKGHKKETDYCCEDQLEKPDELCACLH